MQINPIIFKAYDVRGKYPNEFNEQSAYAIGRAYVVFLNKKNSRIIVGRDNRVSSAALFESLTKGLVESGGNVIDIGVCTTPMFYFTVAHFGFDGGIQITASHNPPDYNGLKIVKDRASPVSEKSGLLKIQQLALKGKFPAVKTGSISKKDVLTDYISFNLQYTGPMTRRFKIVIDTTNAVAGIVAPVIFQKINCEFLHLFADLDGRFPNHLPEPHKAENLAELKKAISRHKADLGIAFDGDGDRVVFIDEKAEMVPPDLITALMAKIILPQNKNAKIIYTLNSSRVVEETIRAGGGLPRQSRVGRSFIVEKMRKENILFGGEVSGHYFHKDFYFNEAPFFVIMKILERLATNQKTLSEEVQLLKKYFNSGELNFNVNRKAEALKALERVFSNGKINRLDGVKIDFADWWFNARPSQTESLLRLIVEAETEELMLQKVEAIKAIISHF